MCYLHTYCLIIVAVLFELLYFSPASFLQINWTFRYFPFWLVKNRFYWIEWQTVMLLDLVLVHISLSTIVTSWCSYYYSKMLSHYALGPEARVMMVQESLQSAVSLATFAIDEAIVEWSFMNDLYNLRINVSPEKISPPSNGVRLIFLLHHQEPFELRHLNDRYFMLND